MQKIKFLVSIIGTAIMIYIMGVTGKNLKTPTTPSGILNLEFANTTSKASTVINAWYPNLISTAKTNTYWDFLFLFFYSFLFFNICTWLYHLLHQSKIGNLGLFFAKLSIVTALLDVVENIFMLNVLSGTYNNWHLFIMSTASYIKWICVVAIILYALIGIFFVFTKKYFTK